MKYMLNGLEVEVTKIIGYDDDAYIESAFYVDNERDLTDGELDKLAEENPESFADDILNRAIVAAEYAFEGDR